MTYIDKWYLAGDGSAGRNDSGDEAADRAGDVEHVSDDEDVKMPYDKHDAVLAANAYQDIVHFELDVFFYSDTKEQ